MNTSVAPVEFTIWTTYHPPLGRSRKGHNEFVFVSRCGRWHARKGNYGTMIVTDRTTGHVEAIKGLMPEVEAYVKNAKD